MKKKRCCRTRSGNIRKKKMKMRMTGFPNSKHALHISAISFSGRFYPNSTVSSRRVFCMKQSLSSPGYKILFGELHVSPFIFHELHFPLNFYLDICVCVQLGLYTCMQINTTVNTSPAGGDPIHSQTG